MAKRKMKVKNQNQFIKYSICLFFFCTTLAAQLELSVYTDKDSYQYGEQIELFCKVTNTTDTAFQFLAGTYQSCQAEFSFNDFNSWEYSACLTLTEQIIFQPHSYRIYNWLIDPIKYSLPNNDGTQMIIGKYYFGLSDTIYIDAPQFLGGQVLIGYLTENADTLQKIRDSLNVTVIEHTDYVNSIWEVWQIEGFQIDSVISHFQEDSILTHIEKTVVVEYESIIDENPLDYYPIHTGDKWYYTLVGQTYDTDPQPYNFQAIWEVTGDTLMPNGNTYFITRRNHLYPDLLYERIDSAKGKIYGYYEDSELQNNEYLIADLTLPVGSQAGEPVYPYSNPVLIEYMQDTLMYITSAREQISNARVYFATGGQYGTCHLSKNVGISRYYFEFDFGYQNWTLDYAIVDGKKYGDSTVVTIEERLSNSPSEFFLSQNYPNPFNPSTVIEYIIPVNSWQSTVGSKHYSASKIQSQQSSIEHQVSSTQNQLSVSLKVYDLLGREVATIINKEQSSGSYQVHFDASNLTSGIYFYRLQYGSFTQTRKMILLR